MRDPRLLVAAAVAAPLLAATVCLSAITLVEAGGGTLLAGRAPANLAEAAASARADLVIGFLRAGQQAAAVYPVHRDVISSAVLQATALEAAIWSRQIELMALLDREGAVPPGDERRALACLAADLGVEDVAGYLTEPGAAPCRRDEALQAVMARTTGADTAP